MALSIKNPEAEKLARDLAAKTGESITQAVTVALRERLKREQGRSSVPSISEALMEIGRHCASLPVLDPRSPDEIIGYDEIGLPR